MRHEIVVSPVVEALLAGRANVESSWAQFKEYGVPFEGHCAMTALPYPFLGFDGAMRALGDALPDGRASIANYNDDRTTTKTDILVLYDRAIELALAQ